MGNQAYELPAKPLDPWHWKIISQCAVYKIPIPAEIIDYYLPDRLVAYAENTRMNWENRHYFLSPESTAVTRTPFDDYIDQLPALMSFDYFLHELSREKNSSIRYNYVIMDDYLIFIRALRFPDRSSRLFCKHITISSRSPLARYAGEIWHEGHGSFIVNNSSGTYKPSDQSIPQVVRLFQHLSPYAHFRGISFRQSALRHAHVRADRRR